MTVLNALTFIVPLALVGLAGFSLAAGFVVYRSSLTVRKGNRKPGGVQDAGLNSPAFVHTRDPVIMERLSAAKERWLANRAEGRFDELSIMSRDALNLAGWYWPREAGAGLPGNPDSPDFPDPADPAGKTVLLVHGFLDSAAGLGYLAEVYHEDGWNVCSIDLRAHGESGGNRMTMGVREAQDLALWIDCLIRRYGTTRLVLHGISLGGAVVLLYGGTERHIPGAVWGIVSDSSFGRYASSIEEVLIHIVGSRFVSRAIVVGAHLWSLVFSGVGFSGMCPQRVIGRIPVPVLLFHGQDDALVPIDSVRSLLEHRQKPGDETVIIPGAPHIGAYFYSPGRYIEAIRNLYRRKI